MKVIFLKDVGGVGQRDTVKEVTDGYAVNFLIARGLAIQATPEKIASLKKKTAENERLSGEHNVKLRDQIRAADGKRVVLKAKANEKGHLFKGIKKDEVAARLGDAFGALITPDTVAMPADSIKEVGEYTMKLAGAGAEATIKLVVEGTRA